MVDAEAGAANDDADELASGPAGAEMAKPENGKVLLLEGALASAIYAMAVRSLLDTGRPAILVDGGCRTDPYTVAEVAKRVLSEMKAAQEPGEMRGRLFCRNRRDVGRVLDGIYAARAFTAHQLEALIVERLEPELRVHRAAFVGVIDFDALFLDRELDRCEAGVMKARCLRRLRHIARDFFVAITVTVGDRTGRGNWVKSVQRR